MAFENEVKLPQFMQEAIRRSIKLAADEEFEAMKQRLDERKAEIVAGVVLNVEKRLHINTRNEETIITIRNEMK